MEVLIGVDPHKASNTVAVFDVSTRKPIDEGRFTSTLEGYRQLRAFVKQWPARRWAGIWLR